MTVAPPSTTPAVGPMPLDTEERSRSTAADTTPAPTTAASVDPTRFRFNAAATTQKARTTGITLTKPAAASPKPSRNPSSLAARAVANALRSTVPDRSQGRNSVAVAPPARPGASHLRSAEASCR